MRKWTTSSKLHNKTDKLFTIVYMFFNMQKKSLKQILQIYFSFASRKPFKDKRFYLN